MKYIVFFILIILGLSCAPKRSESPDAVVMPENIASSDQKNELLKLKEEIQAIADKNNLQKDFYNFPVIVTDDDYDSRHPLGLCKLDSNGNGVFIAISQSTMDVFKGKLFILLVHEFGHCLYRRDHDSKRIGIVGYNIVFEFENEPNAEMVGAEISVSAMAPDVLGFRYPEAVKEYYLLEIAGIRRWKDQHDLESTPGIKLVSGKK
jgi:hypothetical protein